MNIRGFASSLSSRMPSCHSMSKLGFGVMGALFPVFAGMAVKAAGSGSYCQSGFFALTAFTGPALMKNIGSICKTACSSIVYAKDLSLEILSVAKRACDVGYRTNALLPASSESLEPLNAGTVVVRMDRALALSESALDKAEWMAKNPIEAVLLALCAACSYRVLALIALLYGMSEVSKKVLNKSDVKPLFIGS